MAAFYIFVLLALLYPQQAYSDVPDIVVENSEAYNGLNATIPCRYSPPTESRNISWRLSSDPTNVTLVSSTNPVNGRFSLCSKDGGTCTLHISPFQPDDSNTYVVTIGNISVSANLSIVQYIKFVKTEYHHHKVVCEVVSYPSPATVNVTVDLQILKSGEDKVETVIPEEAVNISCAASTSSGQYSIHNFEKEDDEYVDAPISPIAIIGIILGAGALVIIIGLVLFYVLQKRGKEQTPRNQKQETREVREGVAYTPVTGGQEGAVSM